jgi:uncharacterized protein with HEPN domain
MVRRRSNVARLDDILNAIRVVKSAIRDSSIERLGTDELFRFGIERAIEIISEASRHIPDEDKQRHPNIPWRNIKVIGNLIRHEYDRVDAEIIWEIAEVHLGRLGEAVEEIKSKHKSRE